ncbi:MAG: Fe-S cluster assembly protein SufD, partial [Bacteroidota bacterium]|nr:Fe-S cluster assembly protein SufD [Bacteroidota bacterium]
MQPQKYTEAYTKAKNSNISIFPEAVRKEKEGAFEFMKTHELPDKTDERYRYINFDAVFDKEYKMVLQKPDVDTDLNAFFRCEVEDLDTELILLSNGFYYDSTHNGSLPESVIVCSMQEAFHKYPTLVSEHFNRYLKKRGDGWAALNTMLANDGVFIHVPDNVHVPKPIQIVNLAHGFYEKELFQRNLFVVGENASLKLVLCDHSLNNAKTVSHLASELYVGKNSGLQIYNLQNEPDGNNIFNHMAVHQEAGSELLSFAFSLHSGSIRNNIYATLNGPHANSNIFGLTLSDRQQHMDNYVHVDHAVPDCTSNAFFKSILDENSSGAFSGRVLVQKDAQRTVAYQTNNNICLTDTSKMRTKPQLEIYADDVKCSHGATIGQLDEEAMFYLRTRGIDKAEARFMMMFAFANEVVRKIDITPLRNRVENLVSKRLRGDEVLCEHCLLN